MTSMPAVHPIEIRQAVLEAIFWSSASPASPVVEKFSVSRQAVQLHLQRLTREGLIKGEGKVRWRQYQLAPVATHQQRFQLKPGFTEYEAWSHLRPRLEVGADEEELFSYGVTEMVNNVIDHSGGKSVRISLEKTAVSLNIAID